MEKNEVIKEIHLLIELCEDELLHKTLSTYFRDEKEIGYLAGYTEATRQHIKNLNSLIEKVDQ